MTPPAEPWLRAGFAPAVRRGQMVWLAGRTGDPDLDPRAQVRSAVAALDQALTDVGCSSADLVKLLCFHTADVAHTEVERLLGEALGESAAPAVTVLPVPSLPVPGTAVLVEGYAMRGEDGTDLPRQTMPERHGEADARFPAAVRCGRMIFVSAVSPVEDGVVPNPGDIVAQTGAVMARVGELLSAFGAGYGDVVKLNRWYVGVGTVADFEPAALACGAHFEEPGPAATGVPLPGLPHAGQQIAIEVVAMLGEDGSRLPRRHVWPESLWDWTISLPYHHGLKCHNMIFLGGQVSLDLAGQAVHPDEMAPQTREAMEHISTILRALGADLSDVCKLTTVYAGEPGSDRQDDNLRVRAAYSAAHGTAATDVALPVLAYPAMITEIDAFAMAEPDPPDGPAAP